jgi:hypothetical protein
MACTSEFNPKENNIQIRAIILNFLFFLLSSKKLLRIEVKTKNKIININILNNTLKCSGIDEYIDQKNLKKFSKKIFNILIRSNS